MGLNRPDYTLSAQYEQLAMDLDLQEAEGITLSEPERRLRSEAAKAALEGKKEGELPWLPEYLKLREGRWPWRQSAYIAWASAPKGKRKPETQDQLAQLLGLTSDRAFTTWRRRNPMIDEMVATLQTAPLFEHRSEIFLALILNAIKPDYKTHNDRKLALEMMGDYVPASKMTAELLKSVKNGSLDQMSDDELASLAQELVATAKERRDEKPEGE